MRYSKVCPVCRKNKIFRKEVKTCGGIDCVAAWRIMSASEKRRLEEEANLTAEEILERHKAAGTKVYSSAEEMDADSPPPLEVNREMIGKALSDMLGKTEKKGGEKDETTL